jgi:hypothetical protein
MAGAGFMAVHRSDDDKFAQVVRAPHHIPHNLGDRPCGGIHPHVPLSRSHYRHAHLSSRLGYHLPYLFRVRTIQLCRDVHHLTAHAQNQLCFSEARALLHNDGFAQILSHCSLPVPQVRHRCFACHLRHWYGPTKTC